MKSIDRDRPKVSLGMPVYNGEAYLAGTLDSILVQTYPDFELIISDNASTDSTREICEAYAARDSRVRYYRNDTNIGAAPNYNRVFELAAGGYFKWTPHDDGYAPQYLERCVDVLEREADVVLCYPRTVLVDGAGEVIEYHDDQFNLQSPKPHLRFRESFYGSAWCNPVLGLIRAAVLCRTGLIGSYHASDEVLLGELAMYGKYYEVPEYLFIRRLHERSSVQENPGDEARVTWFDPSTTGKVVAPRWRRFMEFHRAIQRSPLGAWDRLLCYTELGRYYISPARFAGVVKDLRQLQRALLRSSQKPFHTNSNPDH
jgi:glycosyltransferase involved in cell wall biosynthesis